MNKMSIDMQKQIGYIYVFQLSSHVSKNIYKIGRTDRTIEERLREYPEATKVLAYMKVYDSTSVEKKILKKFKNIY